MSAVNMHIEGGVGILASAFLPTSLKHAGWLTQLEGDFGIPVTGPRLGIGISVGFGSVEDPTRFEDTRVTSGGYRMIFGGDN